MHKINGATNVYQLLQKKLNAYPIGQMLAVEDIDIMVNKNRTYKNPG